MLTKIIKYIISGGLGFLSNILIFSILINFTNIWYIYSSIISFILSTLIGFNLHKRFTYTDKSKTKHETVIIYYILNVFNILMNTVLIYIFTEYLGIFKIISLILSSILISIYSFIIYKKYIFNN